MTVLGWVQILIYCAIVVAVTPLLGAYMTSRILRRAYVSLAGPAAI